MESENASARDKNKSSEKSFVKELSMSEIIDKEFKLEDLKQHVEHIQAYKSDEKIPLASPHESIEENVAKPQVPPAISPELNNRTLATPFSEIKYTNENENIDAYSKDLNENSSNAKGKIVSINLCPIAFLVR